MNGRVGIAIERRLVDAPSVRLKKRTPGRRGTGGSQRHRLEHPLRMRIDEVKHQGQRRHQAAILRQVTRHQARFFPRAKSYLEPDSPIIEEILRGRVKPQERHATIRVDRAAPRHRVELVERRNTE